MIIGAYSLHLYCDHCKRTIRRDEEGLGLLYDEFVADSRQGAYRVARKSGWRINESKDTAMCPRCVKETLGAKAQADGS